MNYYKEFIKKSYQIRKDLSNKIKLQYNKIPVIIDKYRETDPDISRHKFLLDSNLSCHQFMYLVRKFIDINSYQALFIFHNGISLQMNKSFHEYETNSDGFIYLFYSIENTFG